MSASILHPDYLENRTKLIMGRGLPKKHGWIQKAGVVGQDAIRKGSIFKMYEGLTPAQAKKLRAQRARRALDIIELFHSDIPIYFGALKESQKSGILDVMVMTNAKRAELRMIAEGLPSEL